MQFCKNFIKVYEKFKKLEKNWFELTEKAVLKTNKKNLEPLSLSRKNTNFHTKWTQRKASN